MSGTTFLSVLYALGVVVAVLGTVVIAAACLFLVLAAAEVLGR